MTQGLLGHKVGAVGDPAAPLPVEKGDKDFQSYIGTAPARADGGPGGQIAGPLSSIRGGEASVENSEDAGGPPVIPSEGGVARCFRLQQINRHPPCEIRAP